MLFDDGCWLKNFQDPDPVLHEDLMSPSRGLVKISPEADDNIDVNGVVMIHIQTS